MDIVPVGQLVARPLSWLCPGRLALGKLAILDGDPGLGKSLVALDLCARLSTNRPCPDGGAMPGPANSLVLNAEDGPADTIHARLAANGADLQRVFVVDPDDELPRFPSRAAQLERAVIQTEARLVVLDPLSAFLDASVNMASELSVRQALEPLRQIAMKHRCVPLLIRHLNKNEGSQAAYRGAGSIAFLGLCRSAWLVAPDPQVPGRCVMAQLKNNLAGPQPSLAYEVRGPAGGTPTVAWLGTCDWTARQLLKGSPHAPPRLLERDRAREFLTGFLEDGPRTSQEVWAAAQEKRLSERTIERVKREMEIRSVRISVEGAPRTFWLLKDQELAPPAVPESGPDSLEPWLGPLRERFPPPTPLDDL
jgi:hypothetical protein